MQALSDRNSSFRIGAACALVAMYRSKRLDSGSRKLILNQRSVISRQHHDWFNRTGDCTHTDHRDEGPGEF
jgi:hypothetical protein